MKEIQSSKNPLVKELKKLHTAKGRKEFKKYLIEGFHLVEEAQNSGAKLEYILFTQRAKEQWGDWLDEQEEEKKIFVSEEVMNQLSTLPTPQGIIATLYIEENLALEQFSGKWLILDNVQDPGNVGTMIRTADAAGFAGVILGEHSADIYNPKVLRSMQGSNFHLPILSMDIKQVIEQMKNNGISVYGTELNKDALPMKKVPATQNIALIMGNEGSGVQKEILALTDQNIYIELKGKAESLNVAVAAGILMFHFN